jgi:hypothetical protein
MIYELTLSFNHVTDQIKNLKFKKMKISQNHHIP